MNNGFVKVAKVPVTGVTYQNKLVAEKKLGEVPLADNLSKSRPFSAAQRKQIRKDLENPATAEDAYKLVSTKSPNQEPFYLADPKNAEYVLMTAMKHSPDSLKLEATKQVIMTENEYGHDLNSCAMDVLLSMCEKSINNSQMIDKALWQVESLPLDLKASFYHRLLKKNDYETNGRKGQREMAEQVIEHILAMLTQKRAKIDLELRTGIYESMFDRLNTKTILPILGAEKPELQVSIFNSYIRYIQKNRYWMYPERLMDMLEHYASLPSEVKTADGYKFYAKEMAAYFNQWRKREQNIKDGTRSRAIGLVPLFPKEFQMEILTAALEYVPDWRVNDRKKFNELILLSKEGKLTPEDVSKTMAA